jgi:heme-degrading monooxygenase HmoA
MIIREWRGRALSEKAEHYPKHFRERVIPELRKVAGFCGAQLGRRRSDDQIEYLVLTRWRSIDAIRAFAGDELEHAVVEPEAAAALVSFDKNVRHYEVLEDAGASGQ